MNPMTFLFQNNRQEDDSMRYDDYAKGKFYGCSDYPRCNQIYPVGENGAPVFEGRKGRKEQ